MNPNLTSLLAAMAPEGLILLRVLGIISLLVLIPVGIMLWKHQDRWFGRCEDTPSETSGGLLYGKAQTWMVYVGAVHVALWLAIRW